MMMGLLRDTQSNLPLALSNSFLDNKGLIVAIAPTLHIITLT